MFCLFCLFDRKRRLKTRKEANEDLRQEKRRRFKTRKETINSLVVKEQRDKGTTPRRAICYGLIIQQTGQKSSNIIKTNM